jgi:hypothetical protein
MNCIFLKFSNFVETTTNQLAKYWKDDQRVSVVKLVIQAAKMLAEPGKKAAKLAALNLYLSL